MTTANNPFILNDGPASLVSAGSVDFNTPEKGALQDLLIYAIKGISMYAHRARELAVTDRQVDEFAIAALQMATSNAADIGAESLIELIAKAIQIRQRAKTLYEWVCAPLSRAPEKLIGPAVFDPAPTLVALILQGKTIGAKRLMQTNGLAGAQLEQLCLFELKQIANRIAVQKNLDHVDDRIFGFFHEVLSELAADPELTDLSRLARYVEEISWSALCADLSATNPTDAIDPEAIQYQIRS